MDWNLSDLAGGRFWLLVSLSVASFVGCFLYLHVFSKIAVIDNPDHRSLHGDQTLTGGGLFIFLPSLLYLLYAHIEFPLTYSLFLLLFIGFFDDKWLISAKTKLFLQVVVTLFVIDAFTFDVLSWFGLFSLLALVWWLNLFNFMDGANGMASLHALVVLLFYAFILPDNQSALLILVYAVSISLMIFLYFNLFLGRLFMGDTGSLPLALLLAATGMYAWKQNWVSLPFLALLHSSFIVDATLTLFYRAAKRENLTQAHNTHFYQRKIKSGASHRQVASAYALITVGCALLGLQLMSQDLIWQWSVVALVYLVFSVAFIKTINLAR